MDFGVGFQSHIGNGWKHAVLAEQLGFTNAWFVDSQLITSDVYACLALAAEHTDRIRLGTGVTIVGTRIPPVIAHSIATINELAPGRVMLGLGTGHTAWRTMGMPPVSLAEFRHAVEVCRGLLRGESVPYRARGREAQIRFQDVEHGYVNTRAPVPIYLAASHPKAQALTGELSDGLLTLSLLAPELLERTLAAVAEGWDARPGGRPADFGVVTLGISCVLQPGEAIDSPRVLGRVGRASRSRCTTPTKSPGRASRCPRSCNPFSPRHTRGTLTTVGTQSTPRIRARCSPERTRSSRPTPSAP